jgi:WD40 repeat protein
MAGSRSNTPSVTDLVRAVDAGAAVIGAHFLGEGAVFVTAEENLLLVSPDGGETRIPAHDGGILCSAGDGARIVTGGDDGKVVLTDAHGVTRVIAHDEKNRWIDHVAAGPDQALAWSAGKTAFAQNKKGETKSLDVISTVGGLAFAPKGFRLAIAHYNGASLWFPNLQAAPQVLNWKGSHLGVTMSPDGKFLMTAMQEPTLHGWRLSDAKDMRMSGYAGRVRAMSWSADGGYLATSGSDQIILWPFHGKDGPMNKPPVMYAPHDARLNVVACHPEEPVVAAGYADGLVLLVRLADGAEVLVRRPADAPVTAIAWTSEGGKLAFGCEDGAAGIVDLS